jgi:hypothetical protein
MASKGTEAKHVTSSHVFDCELIPVPPGTKSRARLPRGLEDETSPGRIWLQVGTIAIGALLVGVVLGRFLFK